MAQVMQMQPVNTVVFQRYQPKVTEIGPAQPTSLRANEDQAVSTRLSEALQMPAQLPDDLPRERHSPPTRLRLGLLLN